MKDRIVCKKLQLLTEKELKQFTKYCKREVSSKPVLALGTVLCNQLLSNKLSDEKAFEAVYGKETFNLSKLNKICSKLNSLVSEFVIRELNVNDDSDQQIKKELELLNFYTKRGAGDLGRSTISRVKKQLDKRPAKDAFHFESLSKLYESSNTLLLGTMSKKRNYQESNDNLDLWYCFMKFNQLGFMAADAKIHNRTYEFHLADALTEHLSKNPYGEQPILDLLARSYQLSLGTHSYEFIEEFELQLKQHADNLGKEDVRNLYNCLTYAYYFSEADRYKFGKKLFDLLSYQIENDILLIDGYLPPLTLTNYTSVSLKIKEPEWILNMINENRNKLLPEIRKGSYHFNIAKCLLVKQDYNEAAAELNLLSDYKFKNLQFDLATRRLRIKIYYKLSIHDTEYNRYEPSRTIAAFKKFLFDKKNNLAEEFIESNNAFCNIVLRLSEHTANKNGAKILEKINATKRLEDRAWLTKEVDEIL